MIPPFAVCEKTPITYQPSSATNWRLDFEIEGVSLGLCGGCTERRDEICA